MADAPASIREAAARADVSVRTVSNALNRPDIDFAAAAAVPLSSVRQPRQPLGRTAAQLLLDEALGAGVHQHRQVVFEPELVVRRSSPARPGPAG